MSFNFSRVSTHSALQANATFSTTASPADVWFEDMARPATLRYSGVSASVPGCFCDGAGTLVTPVLYSITAIAVQLLQQAGALSLIYLRLRNEDAQGNVQLSTSFTRQHLLTSDTTTTTRLLTAKTEKRKAAAGKSRPSNKPAPALSSEQESSDVSSSNDDDDDE